MKSLSDILITPADTILTALQIIEAGSVQIALVVDPERKLLGTVTDGDVRRGILRGVKLDEPVARVMNANPVVTRHADGSDEALRTMRRLEIHQLPVVNADGQVVGLERLDDLIRPLSSDTWVVLMAGGIGARLLPLTEVTPKPLLPVGGKPLIETIIGNFIDQGYHRFFLSVNYKADMFKDHFGDGSALGVRIDYLHEQTALGTAGALGLLPERPTEPIIVMNGDLLTSVDFSHLLRFHRDHGGAATMCVRDYSFQVPYGVVNIDGHRLAGIVEKPVQSFFVSAGIYVLNPDVLDLIPRQGSFDMPQLFEAATAAGHDTLVFPIREYWMDIGRFDDLERARTEFDKVFR
jgi:dTDP-glucose pyrophosphorylase